MVLRTADGLDEFTDLKRWPAAFAEKVYSFLAELSR
jgi:hypothetical protein